MGWPLLYSPGLNFFVWYISPCQGVGECVVFQQKKESFVTASGGFIALYSGLSCRLKVWSRSRQGLAGGWDVKGFAHAEAPNMTELLSVLQWGSKGD